MNEVFQNSLAEHVNLLNRRIRTRTYGGVGGGDFEVPPYPYSKQEKHFVVPCK